MTPWTVSCQAPLPTESSRQEHCSRLLFPTPRDLPELGIEPSLLLLLHWQVDSLLLHHMGSPKENRTSYNTKTVQYTEWSLIMDAEMKTLSL